MRLEAEDAGSTLGKVLLVKFTPPKKKKENVLFLYENRSKVKFVK